MSCTSTPSSFTVLPLLSTYLDDLVEALFLFLWGYKAHMVHHKVCYLHPSKGSLGMLNIKTLQDTLRLHFLDRVCTQDDENGNFWNEDAKTGFLSLRSVHSAEVDVLCSH